MVLIGFGGSSVMNLIGDGRQVRIVVDHLGYPDYLLTILGVAKGCAVLAIAFPWGRWTRLKDWAYAGITIDLLGAAASHALAESPFYLVLFPLAVLGVVLTAYFTRDEGPANR